MIDGLQITLDGIEEIHNNTRKRNVAYGKDFLEFIKDKKWIDDERFTCQFAPVADHYCTNKLPLKVDKIIE